MLLSEFVGNESCYTLGLANPVQTDEWGGERSIVRTNAAALAELIDRIRDNGTVVDRMMGNENWMRHFTISYGFIHPKLSEKIVKWKPGHEPSLHRWDMGAAADILFHGAVYAPYFYGVISDDIAVQQRFAPVHMVGHWYQNRAVGPYFERVITYSESPYICVGASRAPVHKWYENRFQGERNRKPGYTRHTGVTIGADSPNLRLSYDWRGGGHPSYHGNGRQQFHHIRTSVYTMASSWLYNRDKVHYGRTNRVPAHRIRRRNIFQMMECAGIAYDALSRSCDQRLPIIEGIDIDKHGSDWEQDERWSFVIASHASYGDLAHRVHQIGDNFANLQIEEINRLPDRSFINPATGRPMSGGKTQQRVQVIGRSYDHAIDFESATRSPDFRQEPGHRPGVGGVDTEGVATDDQGTPRRRRRITGVGRRTPRI